MSITFTSGQSSGFSATSIRGPSLVARAATTTIAVGRGDGHTFSPDNVKVNLGDVVKFEFFPSKHAVARAEYMFPCIPYESTGAGKTGFFSGFVDVKDESINPPSWSITINDTNPIYFYDAAPGLCIEHTMVGVINPEDDGSIYRQKDAARNTKEYRSPGADTTAEQKPAEAKPAEGSPAASSSPPSPLPNSPEGSSAAAASDAPAPSSGSTGSSSAPVSASGSSSSVLPSSNSTEATPSAPSAAPSSDISALASPSLSSSSSSSASASPKETSSLTSSSAAPKAASSTTSPKPLPKPVALSTGTIAGIAVGAIAATALLLTLLFLFRRKLLTILLSLVHRRKARRSRSASRSPNANNADEEPPGSPMSFHDRAAPDSFPWVNTPAFVPQPLGRASLGRSSRQSSRVQDELHFPEEVESVLPPIRVVGHRKGGRIRR
ncbi:hypothetical protein H2199_001937 [Coniosporium tulheliwenetii]|uniref:Uncharacterized protein n=1 Tax=Coniosporium tulheliwenetii TaxID=3383036 RepID=A0ACC2ZL16_9PEZI|nr:hypothetical protein H2199_001937 [Cladosporium sp. JES 115]